MFCLRTIGLGLKCQEFIDHQVIEHENFASFFISVHHPFYHYFSPSVSMAHNSPLLVFFCCCLFVINWTAVGLFCSKTKSWHIPTKTPTKEYGLWPYLQYLSCPIMHTLCKETDQRDMSEYSKRVLGRYKAREAPAWTGRWQQRGQRRLL